ncbi:MAG: putative bifunctional diguanylate cyclase/phosphodiesterase [Actinomycetales bacterium]
MGEPSDVASRLRALELLSDVAVSVLSSTSVEETLQLVASAVVDSLGFQCAVLNIVEGDHVDVVAAAGPQEVRDALLGVREDLTTWDAYLEASEPLGGLCFVDGRVERPTSDLAEWVPDIPVRDDPESWHPLDALFAPLRAATGQLVGILSVDLPLDGRRPGPATVELLERFAAQAALAIERARLLAEVNARAALFRTTFTDAPVGMAVLDGSGRMLEANASCLRILAAGSDDLVGRLAWDAVHPDDLERVRGALQEVLDGTRSSASGEVRSRDGSKYGAAVATRLTTPGPACVLLQLEDVTERRQAEQTLLRQATTDVLTGLANRATLQERLAAALRRDPTGVAVLFCDLDHFKLVNDSYGHGLGDDLLRVVATRLSECAPRAVVARLGGDEFVLLLVGASQESAIAVAEAISAAVSQPVTSRGVTVTPGMSVGIAMGTVGVTVDEILAHADTALYEAKAAGRRRWRIYSTEMRDQVVEQLSLREDLPTALQGRQFELYYQPVVDVAQGTTVGYESLLRWRHPRRGLLLPGAFLDLVFEGELANDVSDWVLERAIADARHWPSRGPQRPFVSVNVAPSQLSRPDLADLVDSLLRRYHLPASSLWIEITEDAVVGERAQLNTLAALRALGVHVVIDDFGSGYAGLVSLRDVPADVIKLDRQLLSGLVTRTVDRFIVESVVDLAHRLGLLLVAEGIEEAGQLAVLRELGIDLAQGWHLGKPQPLLSVRLHRTGVPIAEADEDGAALARPQLLETLASSDTVEDLGRRCIAAAMRLTGASGGSLVTAAAGRQLVTRYSQGYPVEVVNRFRTFSLDSRLPLATATRENRVAWLVPLLADGESGDDLYGVPELSTAMALVAIPLPEDPETGPFEARVLGAIGLSWLPGLLPDPGAPEVLASLADVAARRLRELLAPADAGAAAVRG